MYKLVIYDADGKRVWNKEVVESDGIGDTTESISWALNELFNNGRVFGWSDSDIKVIDVKSEVVDAGETPVQRAPDKSEPVG